MSHTKREKLKLLNRIRRVRGQVEAVERGTSLMAPRSATVRVAPKS